MDNKHAVTATAQTPGNDMQKQHDVEVAHDERRISAVGDDIALSKSDEVAKETAFVGLTKLQAIKKFWRAAVYCYM